MDWEFGVDRCELLNSEWISSEVLLYSTGNSIQSLVIDHDGKQHKKKKIYLRLGHFTAEIGTTLYHLYFNF